MRLALPTIEAFLRLSPRLTSINMEGLSRATDQGGDFQGWAGAQDVFLLLTTGKQRNKCPSSFPPVLKVGGEVVLSIHVGHWGSLASSL